MPTTTAAVPATREPCSRYSWEEWAAAKKIPKLTLDSAVALHRWAIGRELTEKQFDAAIQAARNLVFR